MARPVAAERARPAVDRRTWSIDAAVLAAIAVMLRIPAFVANRHLTYDDGFFGLSAIEMRDGVIPFRDLFSPQGPLTLPLLYIADLVGLRTPNAPRVLPLVADADEPTRGGRRRAPRRRSRRQGAGSAGRAGGRAAAALPAASARSRVRRRRGRRGHARRGASLGSAARLGPVRRVQPGSLAADVVPGRGDEGPAHAGRPRSHRARRRRPRRGDAGPGAPRLGARGADRLPRRRTVAVPSCVGARALPGCAIRAVGLRAGVLAAARGVPHRAAGASRRAATAAAGRSPHRHGRGHAVVLDQRPYDAVARPVQQGGERRRGWAAQPS